MTNTYFRLLEDQFAEHGLEVIIRKPKILEIYPYGLFVEPDALNEEETVKALAKVMKEARLKDE